LRDSPQTRQRANPALLPIHPEGKRKPETKPRPLKVEVENYGTAAHSLNEWTRAEYLECCEGIETLQQDATRGGQNSTLNISPAFEQ